MDKINNKKQILQKKEQLERLSKYMNYEKTWKGLANRKVKTTILLTNNNLKSNFLLKDNELPILEYYNDEVNNFLFTTKSIYYRMGNVLKTINYIDILSIEDQESFFLLKGAPKFIKLKLNLVNGDFFAFEVETGSPMKAVILLIIWNKNNNIE
ncbi:MULTISPECIES: hypothetical protein [unclassified Tenacibaculum]|uniref:hypothetical protein n=1 Tax=unclassified Tenacibaculum TaxID=2635139 RepID=UPI001F15FD08|nr:MULTISPECIES: hypothetical protein [unclassified Tenacibaculum]MCF2875585.1 hypothetical protein [Tenacibaculum sp. Cn5-1]MCF2935661.1 hypothetical protein [Tenacibaculum sp. Cn5-34]MCG7512221.1 hypothetical protein [Tenacibaculum sp. Cn5-46]